MNEVTTSADSPAIDELEFENWLREGRLPQIKTGVQQRSVRTAYALLQSGATLLRSRAFDALSIEEICAAAGATAGAFYGRFDDKKSYFSALQQLTCLRSEAALAEFVKQVSGRKLSLTRICEMVVKLAVQRYRANLGIYRAALQHAGEGAWEPFRKLGDRYRSALTEILSPYLSHLPSEARALQVQFAYQVVVGTLVNATLNDPGPVHLNDDAMVGELTDIVVRYLSPRSHFG